MENISLLTNEEIKAYIIPLVAFLGSLIIGYIIERLLIGRLHAIAKKTKWKGDDIFVNSIRNLLFIVIGVLGMYISIQMVEIKEKHADISNTILVILIILIFTVFIKRIVVSSLNEYIGNKTGKRKTPSILQNISKISIYVIGILVILQTLGISITPLITALGIGGLAVALALQSTLSNLFSGIYILLSKHIQTNDYVQLDSGEEGYVIDITMRNATIRDLTGNVIVIPNSKLAESIVKNYHLEKKNMNILVEVGVAYDSDLEKVEEITVEVATKIMKEIDGGDKDFTPFIRYMSFGDSSINFLVYLKVKKYFDQYVIRHEFIKALHKKYNVENIEIPFPIRTVYHKNKAE
jgi:small-conductance mechanosensitive channel